jgi:hypothetical protein
MALRLLMVILFFLTSRAAGQAARHCLQERAA